MFDFFHLWHDAPSLTSKIITVNMKNTNTLKCKAQFVQEIKDMVSWFKYADKSAMLTERWAVVEGTLWYSSRLKKKGHVTWMTILT